MNYKNKLLAIISHKKEELDFMLESLMMKYKKIYDVSEDFNRVNDIDDEDLHLFSSKTNETILFIKKILKMNCLPEDTESIKEIKDNLLRLYNEEIDSSKKIKELKEIAIKLDEEEKLVNSDIHDNYSSIMELLIKYYEEGLLSSEEVMEANLTIASEAKDLVVGLDGEDKKKKLKTVLFLEEYNNEPDTLKDIFNKYGYTYDILSKKTKGLMEKYVDVEYLDYVLSIFNKYNVSDESIKSYQKTVYKILVDKESKDILGKVLEFVDNNNCTLGCLLRFEEIFHKQMKKFVKRNSADKKGYSDISSEDEEDAYYRTKGNHDDFMKNLELLMKIKKIDKIDDKTLCQTKNIALCLPHEKLLANLDILREYGIIGKDELPKSLSSLSGKYTAYQIDRFIECGLYDYIKKNHSYVNRTSHPFKFYKIRRALDLREKVISEKGMKDIYSADVPKSLGQTESVNGVYYRSYEEDGEIKEEVVQEVYTPEQFRASSGVRNSVFTDLLQKYNTSYRFREIGPKEIIERYIGRKGYELSDEQKIKYQELIRVLTNIFSIYKESDFDFSKEVFEKAQESLLVRIFDNGNCLTNRGTFDIKKDDYTYEFRAYRHPNDIIRISRIKVIKLFHILDNTKVSYNYEGIIKESSIWDYLNDNGFYDREALLNVILSVVTYDSILSEWEISNLNNVLNNVMGGRSNSMEERGNNNVRLS